MRLNVCMYAIGWSLVHSACSIQPKPLNNLRKMSATLHETAMAILDSNQTRRCQWEWTSRGDVMTYRGDYYLHGLLRVPTAERPNDRTTEHPTDGRVTMENRNVDTGI